MILREFRMAGEIRAASPAGKSMRLSGLAARYNSATVIGDARSRNRGFKEVLAPGAFRAALTAAALKESNPSFRLNHDMNKVYGRVSSGTLRLRDTSDGLAFEVDLPNTADAAALHESVMRGDLNGCSFGFSDIDEKWDVDENRFARRTIRSIRALHDVSVVTEPAYRETFVQARDNGLQPIEYRDGRNVVIPDFILEQVSDEDAADVIRRRRQLLNAVL